MRRDAVVIMMMTMFGLALATGVAAEPVTVLYDDQVIDIERTLADPNDLWVVPKDLIIAVDREGVHECVRK